jgi:hypothetical protein
VLGLVPVHTTWNVSLFTPQLLPPVVKLSDTATVRVYVPAAEQWYVQPVAFCVSVLGSPLAVAIDIVPRSAGVLPSELVAGLTVPVSRMSPPT